MLPALVAATRRELERLEDVAQRPRYFVFGRLEERLDRDGWTGLFAGFPERVGQAARFSGDREGEEVRFAIGETIVTGEITEGPDDTVEIFVAASELAARGLSTAVVSHLTEEGIEYVMDNRDLVAALHGFLEGRRELPEAFVAGVLPGSPASPFDSGVTAEEVAGLNPSQREAVAKALRQRVTFVWGPPGTGKTRTLGALAAHLVRAGKRVLLAAQSNGALDQLFLSAVDRLGGELPEVAVARLGRSMADAAGPFSSLTFNYAQFKARKAGHTWREQARRASLVAANFAKLATARLDDPGTVDYAIVDEVSMANLPNLAVAMARAREAIVLGGDPMQLPPVASEDDEGRENAWYAQSVFERAGVTDAAARRDPRVAFLDTQYRMQREIGDLVSAMFYDGELRTAAAPEPAVPGFPGRVVLVDRAGRVESADGGRRSAVLRRWNTDHAAAAARAAAALRRAGVRQRDIGIIAPYNAQVSRIHAELRAVAGSGKLKLAGIKVSTVHSFQGQERRAMIVDFTDNNVTPSPLSTDPRLVNVALSRAQEVLVVIGNGGYLTNPRFFSPEQATMFDRMLSRCARMEL